MNHRSREASQRFAERRKREDDAPRLKAVVPELEALALEVNEHRGASAIGGSKHLRRVVVEHAPALFVLSCGDPSCKDGGHDITAEVLRHLRQHETDFSNRRRVFRLDRDRELRSGDRGLREGVVPARRLGRVAQSGDTLHAICRIVGVSGVTP